MPCCVFSNDRLLLKKANYRSIARNTIIMFCLAVGIKLSAATVIPLNRGWYFNCGYESQSSGKVMVDLPHTWNAADAMFGNTDYYRGMANYSRYITLPPADEGQRVFLRINAAQTVADVYLDNHFISQHKGGYTAFTIELTPYIRTGTKQKLDIRVSNAQTMEIAPICGDFNIWGGLNRGVELLLTDDVCIDPTFYGSSGVFFTQHAVSEKSASLEVKTLLSVRQGNLDNCTVAFSLLDARGKEVLRKEAPAISAETVMNLTLNKPHLWDGINDPYLYTGIVVLKKNGNEIDRREERIGFRYYSVDPDKGFFLNGKPYPIQGANYHEDRAERASAFRPDDFRTDLDLIQEMGCTAVRLSHYPQAKLLHQMMDSRGLIAWAEIPFVNIYVSHPQYRENLKQQLAELIYQNYNHPCILTWGLFNEINPGWMEDPNPMAEELNKLAKQWDSSRHTVGASNQDDRLNGIPDFIAYNRYFGWYGDECQEMGQWIDNEHRKYPERCMGISEYGAGGDVFQQTDSLIHPEPWGQWHPENWQTFYHIENWKLLSARPFLWCKFIWCMFDFSAAGRREGVTFGRNDKGLVTYDRSTKKDAFYFYKANWNKKEKVLHIASKRCRNRTIAQPDIQVFSNCGEVELLVNGESMGKCYPDEVCVATWENVPLKNGENRIEVRASGMTDHCVFEYLPGNAPYSMK